MSEFEYLSTNGCGGTKAKPAWISGMTIEDAESRLHNDLRQIKRAFISIGLTLKYVRDNKLYLQDDTGSYKNVYEWAFAKLDMKKAKTVRHIQIVEQFPINMETMELEGKYKDFLYSHIVELLPMNNELLEMIKPGMTVTQIKNIRKEYEKNIGTGEKTVFAQKGSAGSFSNPEDMDGISSIVDMVQIDLPVFESDEDIREWLLVPEKWYGGLWYTDENIEAKYYKFDFENGCRLIAVKYKYSFPLKRLDSLDEYQHVKEADGSFCEEPYFHLIYSADYLRSSDLYDQQADRYFTHNTVSVEFLIEFIRKIQKVDESSENNDYAVQIPGQIDIFEVMDMEEEEVSLPSDRIIMAYNLEDSAVLRKVLDLVDDQSLDAEIIDEKVGGLLDSASPDERIKIERALKEIFDYA